MWAFVLGCIVGSAVGAIAVTVLTAGKIADARRDYALLRECHDDHYQGMLIALERVAELEERLERTKE